MRLFFLLLSLLKVLQMLLVLQSVRLHQVQLK
jgi:hypothetical protein